MAVQATAAVAITATRLTTQKAPYMVETNMSIRAKIVLIALPLIITPLIFTAIVSGLSARNGITTIATQFLQFKAEELVSYANNQWSLLESNNLQGNQSFLEAAKSAIQSFAEINKGLRRQLFLRTFSYPPDTHHLFLQES